MQLEIAGVAELTSGPFIGDHRKKMEALLRYFHRGGAHIGGVRGRQTPGPQGRNAQALCAPHRRGVPGLCAVGIASEEGKAGEEIQASRLSDKGED